MGKKISDFLKKNPSSTKANASGDANPYAAYMRKLAATPKEKYDNMPPKKKAAVAGAKSWVKEQDDIKLVAARAEAQQKAEIVRAREEKRQVQIAALRAVPTEKLSPKQVVSRTANFIWGWDIKSSLQGVVIAVALLVQILAQMFITVGLIAPDHPARTAGGAKGFGLFKLLEEARLNLLPLGTMFERRVSAQFDGIRALATRQYVFFTAAIGVLVVGTGSVLFGLSQIAIGVAHADTTSSVVTSGTGIGGCSLASGTGTTDTASACIDSLFGTGGATTSLIGAGLGKMLAAYSSMALVIAGIMVLWTIISVVADTARTGVPFGKNFNPVWAPIRLIVALGLLVPLPSGLNSGQYIVISLSKWGSQQATSMWSSFASGVIITGSSSGSGSGSGSSGSGSGSKSTTTSGLASAPFSYIQANTMASNLLRTATCAAINDKLCTSAGGACTTIGSPSAKLLTASQASANVAAGAAAGSAASAANNNTIQQSATITWQTSDSQNGGVNCGSFKTPLTTTQGSSSADLAAVQTLMTANNQNAANFMNTIQNGAAAQLATSTYNSQTNGGQSPDLTPAAKAYADALVDYYNAQTKTISSTLTTYNAALSSNLSTSASNNGWISAPIWLTQVAEQNANVLGATSITPTATGPVVEYSSGRPSLSSSIESVTDAYDQVNQWMQTTQWQEAVNAEVAAKTGNSAVVTTAPNAKEQAANNIINDLQSLTAATARNPLSATGTYGRALTLAGFTLIEPADVNYCLNTKNFNNTDYNSKCGSSIKNAKTSANNAMGGGNRSVLPYQNADTSEFQTLADDPSTHAILYPIGMIMIAMGFMLIGIPFIPCFRFILGILGWIMLLFVAILAVPLMALSLLAQMGGEGFSTQQFTTDMWMLVGLIVRPMLMTLGLVFGLEAFNTIMQITNMIFAPMVANLTPASDNSLLSLGIYVMFYASLTYTLANSAFKMIDLMPNWVMNWIGARMETMTDDAAQIQQQSGAYMQTLAYSNRADQADLSGAKAQAQATTAAQQSQANQAIINKFGGGTTTAGATGGTTPVGGATSQSQAPATSRAQIKPDAKG